MSKPTQKFETKGQYTLKMYITPYKNKERSGLSWVDLSSLWRML